LFTTGGGDKSIGQVSADFSVSIFSMFKLLSFLLGLGQQDQHYQTYT
jgi:hypothetical protein